MRTRRRHPRGFSIVELMLVVTILGVMAQIAFQEFEATMTRAKRTEGIVGLTAVWKAQKAYLARTGHYARTFHELEFQVFGGRELAPNVYKGGRYTYQLVQPWGASSFYCVATAQLDRDTWPDILEIFEQTGG